MARSSRARIGGHATAVGAATGAVVGLVGITPGAGFVSPLSALAIGALTALASFTALRLRARTSLDDTLDVFACHGIGGITGSLLTGVFASKAANPDGGNGLLFGGAALFGIQAATVAVVFLYTLAVTAGVLLVIRAVTPLRVSSTPSSTASTGACTARRRIAAAARRAASGRA